ncbi:hypothetical protein AUK40_01020 [Candidatus Wirthbacteria bacterium CG2_30_54_11]|uniref:Glycerate kinase n=1 Tax=Candidatus Wirthbacteria bacterium CG2_30_54_11 TaxID=1817892 RepID=A0A1J5IP77_9BACT|nr:MAG: hypothetical protein AUK40_01020 [Candidatus Wirthbacteria bacterium CG2_30_54_11]
MRLIRNYQRLVENALTYSTRQARDIALELSETGIDSVMPSSLMRSHIACSAGKLEIGDKTYDLDAYDHLWLIGMGKASGTMAREMEEILGERITGGCIVDFQDSHLERVETWVGSHPVPDERSQGGADRLLTIARLAGERDLILALVSGGGSSLAEAPCPGLTLADIAAVNQLLLTCNAAIEEVNLVRQCLSRIKSGGLVRSAMPATLVTLMLSDVPFGLEYMIASGPTFFREKKYAEAVEVLHSLQIWNDLPDQIRSYFQLKAESGDQEFRQHMREAQIWERDHHQVMLLGSRRTALKAMESAARDRGFDCVLSGREILGNARTEADLWMRMVDQNRGAGKRVFIGAGETTVRVQGAGKGGRAQEFVLSALSDLAQMGDGAAVLSMGTDGIDNSVSAGAIGDSHSFERARRMDMDVPFYLEQNDSFSFFEALEDQLLTGPTGTNVGDLFISVLID